LNVCYRILFFAFAIFLFSTHQALAEEEQTREQELEERMAYYAKYSNPILPWYYLAAIDQFERNIQAVRSDIPKGEGPISIYYPSEFWNGALNPSTVDTSKVSITFFNGYGRDGNNDGIVDAEDPDDKLYTLATYISSYGATEQSVEKALMDYYERKETVKQIMTISTLYKHFQTLNLDQRAFPLPVHANYSYRSTWGVSRGWGGRRIHEGTDLFAGYGVPVLSTSYGIIEVMGWNDYGGWRVGIRDMYNTYHYYAHLSGFNKEIKEGDVVEPGTMLGYVGSSGYGKEGTSGRFAPHLHYGMYKYNGRTEWAFDPFPYLRLWEREDKNKKQ
jgi:peptidoglycan LD-endopeptidase LytH